MKSSLREFLNNLMPAEIVLDEDGIAVLYTKSDPRVHPWLGCLSFHGSRFRADDDR